MLGNVASLLLLAMIDDHRRSALAASSRYDAATLATSSPQSVMGSSLATCSAPGEAMTGFTRTGSCVDLNDDAGSHHICIEMKADFCTVTGQDDWCSQPSSCMGQTGQCPIKHWCAAAPGSSHHTCVGFVASFVEDPASISSLGHHCRRGARRCVCQWAFASYLAKAGGCDKAVDLKCEAVNQAAVKAYTASSEPTHKAALACLKQKCGI
uniref:Uncharacterized protein n=1 Tax=Prymnesium polylepis TaxID=72548 RepID=A0A7S4MMB9_9EUKA